MSEFVNARGLIDHAHYNEGMQAIENELSKIRQDQELQTPDGAKLFVSCFPVENAKGTVMILHGFTENAYKFQEVIHGFVTDGWSVVAYDQRGHGRSFRDSKTIPTTVYIDRFETYIEDFKLVYDRFVAKAPGKKILFAHSMGGAVALLALENTDKVFDKAVLSSPMVAPATGGVPLWAGRLCCYLFFLIGKAKERIFFSAPYTGHEDFETSCASSPERFTWYDDVKFNNKEYQTSNPSYRWTLESMNVTKKILKKSAPESIQIPVRIYSAELDNTVLIDPQKEAASRIPKGEFIPVKAAKHEIYRSTDEVLYPWWDSVIEYING